MMQPAQEAKRSLLRGPLPLHDGRLWRVCIELCCRYIDLNVVRAGVVQHPEQWRWCGYGELAGQRKRHRLLDREALVRWLGFSDAETFVTQYASEIARAIQADDLQRQAMRTESIAVGEEAFVKNVASQMRRRRRLYRERVDKRVWIVREEPIPYS
jgi:putative transposase